MELTVAESSNSKIRFYIFPRFFFISASSADCVSIPDWSYNHTIPKNMVNEDADIYLSDCDGTRMVHLTSVPLIPCDGTFRNFSLPCAPTAGKNVGTALVLSVFLNIQPLAF
jgi:hypothetical protein